MSEEISIPNTEADSSNIIIDIDQLKELDNIPQKKFFPKNIISKIDSFDKILSNYIHEMTLNNILESIIYFCGRLFNPDIIAIFYISLFFLQYFMNKNLYYIIKPAIHVIVVFLLTGILKFIIKRPRPEIIKKVKRLYNLRKKETNFSMPSGDSIQAANFAIIGLFYFHISFYGFILIPFVMFSRIFYFCHYLFDTIVGAFIGLSVSFGLIFPLRYLNL